MELRCLGMGGVADPMIHAPPRHVLSRQIWLFCDKGFTHKSKGTPKIGEHWDPPLFGTLPICVATSSLLGYVHTQKGTLKIGER